MGVTIPLTIKKFKTLEDDFGTTIAQALFQRAAQAANFINAAIPVGKVMLFHSTQTALPSAPDSRYWQKLDGSVVTNSLSPLFGQTLPDVRARFVREPHSGEAAGTIGGADTRTLTHNHGGVTGKTDDRGPVQMDNGDASRREPEPHTHPIPTQTLVVDIRPPYRAVDFYIRIV